MARLSSFEHHADEPAADDGATWASVVAILFAAVAVISFAVDQSVTLSSLPQPPAADAAR